jgi:hypothetical protein
MIILYHRICYVKFGSWLVMCFEIFSGDQRLQCWDMNLRFGDLLCLHIVFVWSQRQWRSWTGCFLSHQCRGWYLKRILVDETNSVVSTIIPFTEHRQHVAAQLTMNTPGFSCCCCCCLLTIAYSPIHPRLFQVLKQLTLLFILNFVNDDLFWRLHFICRTV